MISKGKLRRNMDSVGAIYKKMQIGHYNYVENDWHFNKSWKDKIWSGGRVGKQFARSNRAEFKVGEYCWYIAIRNKLVVPVEIDYVNREPDSKKFKYGVYWLERRGYDYVGGERLEKMDDEYKMMFLLRK